MSETDAAVIGEPASEDKFDKLLAALTAAVAQTQQPKGLDIDSVRALLEEMRQQTGETLRQIVIPENKVHPGVSVFSHPEGDLKQPKPALGYELLWNGYPVHQFPETETWDEWAACGQLAPLVPGEYTVLRNDLSKMAVAVTGEKDADGKPTKILVTHPQTREDKDKVPSKDIVVYQMQHQDNLKAAFSAAMQRHLEQMVNAG